MAKLDKKHVETALSWKEDLHLYDDIDRMKGFFHRFPTAGIFKAHSFLNTEPYSVSEPSSHSDQTSLQVGEDTKGELVACTFLKYNGDIGYTYTKPRYRRQGFGSAVTLEVANQAFKHKLPACVTIWHKMENSLKMHEKIGFRKLDHEFTYQIYEK